MAGDFRITVRGVMSERVRQGFPGLRCNVRPGHTVLEGEGTGGRPVADVLATLGNLGLEDVAVESPGGTPTSEED